MRQILYQFHRRGMYYTKDSTVFGEDKELTFLVEPHNFTLQLSGERLRQSSCSGYSVTVSHQGAVAIYDHNGALLASIDGTEQIYHQARLFWKQDQLRLEFGSLVTVDYYPNCDGESDRWGQEWMPLRTVAMNLEDNSLLIV